MYLTKLNIVFLGLVTLLWFILYQSNEYYFYDNPPNTECAICMDEFTEENPGIISCPNNHQFHRSCINRWIQTRFNSGDYLNCPVCRSRLKDDVIEQSGVGEEIRHREAQLQIQQQQIPHMNEILSRQVMERQEMLYQQLLEQRRRQLETIQERIQRRRQVEESLRNNFEMMQERILQRRREQLLARYGTSSSSEDNFFIGLFIGYLVLTVIIYIGRKIRGTGANAKQ